MQLLSRVRNLLWNQWMSRASKVPPCTVWCAILHFETSQANYQHRLRNAYEHFILKPEIRRSPTIWQSYLNFEIAHGTVAKAKRIFYRAINACPQAKDVWLSCARPPLLSLFSRTEVDGLLEVMTEKELRLHADLN